MYVKHYWLKDPIYATPRYECKLDQIDLETLTIQLYNIDLYVINNVK